MTASPTVPVLAGLRDLVAGYDGVICDLWGVIHGGVAPYPGVLDALERLRATGLPVGLLSNAPRRRRMAIRLLEKIGVPGRLYDVAVTSGDLTREAVLTAGEAGLGRRYLYVGPGNDVELLEDSRFSVTAKEDEADFLLVVGFEAESDPIERYDPLLERARARGLPLYCANPDRVIRRQDGGIYPCAGLIAERYERMGGRATSFGKPHPGAFTRCRDELGLGDGARVLVLGDSLETDIPGALAAGMDPVLIARGIHAGELGVEPGNEPSPEAVAKLCAAHDVWPKAALATLRW